MGWSDSGDTSDFSEHVALDSSDKETIKPKKKDNQKRHACTHEGCKSVFSRPYRLAAHLKVHDGEKPFPCEFKNCKKSYTNKSHLTRHINTAHSKNNSTVIICCPQCDNLFSNQQNLKKHIRRKHDRDFPFRCDYCQIGFLKKKILAAHMYLHTGIKSFKCDFCEETFPNQTDCYNHRKHHKIYKCVCGKEFTRWSEIVKHRKNEHTMKVYQCDDCKKVFKTKGLIAAHVKTHIIPADRDVFVCPFDYCPKYYPYKRNLTFHIKSVHEGKTFDCTFLECNAKLSTQAKLDKHRAQHLPLKTPLKVLRKKQSKRKDAGKPKRSSAVKLAQVIVPLSMESEIIKQSDIPIDVLCIPETSATDKDLSSFDVFASDSSTDLQRVTNTNILYFSKDTIIK